MKSEIDSNLMESMKMLSKLRTPPDSEISYSKDGLPTASIKWFSFNKTVNINITFDGGKIFVEKNKWMQSDEKTKWGCEQIGVVESIDSLFPLLLEAMDCSLELENEIVTERNESYNLDEKVELY